MAIRPATGSDAAACAALYAPYVRDTAVTFELVPPTAAQVADRIAAAHEWLVSEHEDRVVGYAYASAYNDRAAYDRCCEVSVYLEPGRRRTGSGRALYTALLDRLAGRGYRQALACMTLPNEASAGLHRAMGFEPVGTMRAVGWKLGAWQDVAWFQRPLGDGAAGAPGSLD